jgi:uncharacterized membrane protein
MNTIFKLYYQAWLLLSFVAVYSIVAAWRALAAARSAMRWLWAVLAAGLALAMAVYPLFAIPSQLTASDSPPVTPQPSGLDGLAYLNQMDPTEYQAIEWIRRHTAPTAVIAEAGGTDAPSGSNCGEYWVCPPTQSFDKVSALTGRPTILGWPASHESLWRGSATDAAAAALLQQREQDIRTLYTTSQPALATAILRRYDVRYVYVGPVERGTYSSTGTASVALTGFSRLLKVAYANADVTIYAV